MQKTTAAKSTVTAGNPAAQAHLSFSKRVMALRTKASAQAKAHAEAYANNNAGHLRNKAYISEGEADGIKEVFHKLYINGNQTEGIMGVFLIQGTTPSLSRELTKSQMRKVLQGIQASMTRTIDELTVKVSQQSFKALTTPEGTLQHATVQRRVLTLHGRLAGSNKVLAEFQKCYHDLL